MLRKVLRRCFSLTVLLTAAPAVAADVATQAATQAAIAQAAEAVRQAAEDARSMTKDLMEVVPVTKIDPPQTLPERIMIPEPSKDLPSKIAK